MLINYKSESKSLKTLIVIIVGYDIIIPFLKTGQKLLLVITDGCLATRQNGIIYHTWSNKTITMQLDFPYLHTVMALPERHTDVSIYGYMDLLKFLPIPKRIKNIILYFKKIKTRDKQLC